jgi:hypothetical protein
MEPFLAETLREFPAGGFVGMASGRSGRSRFALISLIAAIVVGGLLIFFLATVLKERLGGWVELP